MSTQTLQPRSWLDFLPQAEALLGDAKLKYGDFGARCETQDDPDNPGGDPAKGDKIDAADPKVAALIAKAVQDALAQERKAAAKKEEGLRTNRDDLKAEKGKYTALGTVEDVEKWKKAYEDAEREAAAGRAGKSPEDFQRELDAQVAEKMKLYDKQQSQILEQLRTENKDLTDQNTALTAKAHRAFVAEQVVRANLPKDFKLVQDGAWDHLIDSLVPYVREEQPEGAPYAVPRMHVNGVDIPGKAAGNGMDLREFMPHARRGGDLIPNFNVSYAFASNAAGTDTRTPDGKAKPTGNWWTMTEEQRDQAQKDLGKDGVRDLIDASPLPEPQFTAGPAQQTHVPPNTPPAQ